MQTELKVTEITVDRYLNVFYVLTTDFLDKNAEVVASSQTRHSIPFNDDLSVNTTAPNIVVAICDVVWSTNFAVNRPEPLLPVDNGPSLQDRLEAAETLINLILGEAE